MKYLSKDPEGTSTDHKLIKNNLFEYKMYNITFPHNDEIIKEMKINKFVKTSDLDTETIANIIWELVKNYLVTAMDNFNKHEYHEWSKNNKF